MKIAGLDIGGTKIEVQVFDADWQALARHRVPTPTDYDALVAAVADQISWAEAEAGPLAAVGVGCAGLVNPETGLAMTANLPATDRPFPADIARAAGRSVTYINDCRALALSEAVCGAGQGHRRVMALIIGTGIGGGVAVDGALHPGPTTLGGEFGHIAAPAHVVAAHDLPIYPCGCGRRGCIETYVAGPGLERLCAHLTGSQANAPEIAAGRHDTYKEVWAVWCAFAAELVHTLTLIADPDVIVLGGGLSSVPDVADDIRAAAQAVQLQGFSVPRIVVAQGGDASGARGAAIAAMKDLADG